MILTACLFLSHILSSPDPETLPEREYEGHFSDRCLKNREIGKWVGNQVILGIRVFPGFFNRPD